MYYLKILIIIHKKEKRTFRSDILYQYFDPFYQSMLVIYLTLVCFSVGGHDLTSYEINKLMAQWNSSLMKWLIQLTNNRAIIIYIYGFVLSKMDNWVYYIYKLLHHYILNAEIPLSDPNVYKDVFFNEKILQELLGKGKMRQNQLKYFTNEYKTVSMIGKRYFLLKLY